MSASSRVLKLVRQIDKADGRAECPDEYRRLARSLTDTEEDFLLRAIGRGMGVLRSGWPDFLVTDPKSGKTYGVEVKGKKDVLRKSQKRMFAALERLGIKVFVWWSWEPWKLIAWRRFGRLRGSMGETTGPVSSKFDTPPRAREGERK